MSNIQYSETHAVKIGGDFFKNWIILPHPDEYLNIREVENATTNIFTSIMKTYGFYGDTTIQPVKTSNFIMKLQNEIIDALGNEIAYDHTAPDEVVEIVKGTIADGCMKQVMNNNNSTDSGDDSDNNEELLREGGIIRITRLVLQTIYDKLSSHRTHMRVENPLNVTDYKWGGVTDTYNTDESVTMHFGTTNALELSGSVFTERIIMPIPNTSTMSTPDARALTRTVFDWSIEYTRLDSTDEFTGVSTDEFAAELRSVIVESIRNDCGKINSNTATKGRLFNILDDVFVDTSNYNDLPETIWSPQIIVHITRMTLQKLFDAIRVDTTHMSVDNPFHVTKHKWDETMKPNNT